MLALLLPGKRLELQERFPHEYVFSKIPVCWNLNDRIFYHLRALELDLSLHNEANFGCELLCAWPQRIYWIWEGNTVEPFIYWWSHILEECVQRLLTHFSGTTGYRLLSDYRDSIFCHRLTTMRLECHL